MEIVKGIIWNKYTKTFFIVIAVFVLLLTLAYCIPKPLIDQWYTVSINYIDNEGLYQKFFFNESNVTLVDTFTDRLMIDMNNLNISNNPLIAALDCNGYARYWHGYQVTLRPLLMFMSYSQIRYVNMFVFFELFFFSALMLNKKTNMLFTMIYVLSIVSSYIMIIPMCLQYLSVFLVMFISIIIMLKYFDKLKKNNNFYLFFMILGMITNFVDLLTAPLITLGMPLIIYLYLEKKELKTSFMDTIKCSVSWFLGYGLTWISKWVIGTVVLDYSVLNDAGEQVIFRSVGDSSYSYNLFTSIKNNISSMFLSQGNRMILLFVVIVLICFVIKIFRNKGTNYIKNNFIYLFVSLYPFVWYCVLQEHSDWHNWFTYRILICTIFGVLTFVIDDRKPNKC